MIRKDPSAPARVPVSIDTASRFLSAARNNLGIREFEMAEIAAYNCAFHSARALLFSHGYIERSHACLITALAHFAQHDQELRELLSTLDKLRLSRHNVQYGGALVRQDEAEYATGFASRFSGAIRARLQ